MTDAAKTAALRICGYCETRFPTEPGPCRLSDVPWFTECVQKAIDDTKDKTFADQASEIEELKQQLTEANETVDRLKIIIMSEEVKRLADQG